MISVKKGDGWVKPTHEEASQGVAKTEIEDLAVVTGWTCFTNIGLRTFLVIDFYLAGLFRPGESPLILPAS